MAKSTVWVVGALAAVVAVGFGSVALIGKKVETLMDADTRAAIEQFAPVVKVVDLKYEKSFTGATRTVTVQIGCEGDAVPLTWKDTIQYGPLPGLSHIGMAHIETEFVVSEDTKKQLKEVLGVDSVPLKIQTTIGLLGGLDSTANLAALKVEKDGTKFDMAASSLRVTRSSSGQINSETKFPNITLAGPNDSFRFVMKDYTAHSEGSSGPYWWSNMFGSSSASMGSLELSGTMPAHNGYEDEEAMAAPVAADNKFVFKASALESLTTTAVDKDLASLSTRLTANNIQVNGMSFDKFEIKESAKRIHMPTLNAIIEKLINKELLKSMCGAGTIHDRMNQYLEANVVEIPTLVAKFLPFDPEYAVDKVALTKAGKEGSFGYSFGAKGMTQQEVDGGMANSSVLMKKVVASAELRIPLSWVSMFANTVNPEAGMTDALVEQQIQPMVEQGFVLREGEYLVTKGEFKDGKGIVNGKPIPGMQ